MSARFSKLNTRLAVVIGTILIVFLTLDILYSVKSSRDTAIHEVERWSVLLAETVRVSLNTLMKEEKMDARFGMFESMSKEIPGLEAVRVIRGEKVNERFMKVRKKTPLTNPRGRTTAAAGGIARGWRGESRCTLWLATNCRCGLLMLPAKTAGL